MIRIYVISLIPIYNLLYICNMIQALIGVVTVGQISKPSLIWRFSSVTPSFKVVNIDSNTKQT